MALERSASRASCTSRRFLDVVQAGRPGVVGPLLASVVGGQLRQLFVRVATGLDEPDLDLLVGLRQLGRRRLAGLCQHAVGLFARDVDIGLRRPTDGLSFELGGAAQFVELGPPCLATGHLMVRRCCAGLDADRRRGRVSGRCGAWTPREHHDDDQPEHERGGNGGVQDSLHVCLLMSVQPGTRFTRTTLDPAVSRIEELSFQGSDRVTEL